jgi:hypothetical protein
MRFEWLKRVKLYHRYLKHLKCFYDEVYMCLADKYQLLDFNHDFSNCTDRNYCENGGRCLQRRELGQLNFACVCPECITGEFCQLKMTQFSMTLDSMIGQEILTDVSFSQQPLLIKSLFVVVVFMVIIGIIFNVIASMTFSHTDIRQYGCGNYLLLLSFVCQLALITFLVRFIYLLVSQMTIINDKSMQNWSCILLDFVLSVLISVCDWLTVCIASERTVHVIKGVKFNKQLSVRLVKFIFPLLVSLLVLFSLSQLFNRTLISDPRNNDRLWCVIKYPHTWLQSYEVVLNLINTIVPFFVNFLSGIVVLVTFVRIKQRTNTQTRYENLLMKQVRRNKHLIISPLLMIVFNLPLFIVLLVIKCIQSRAQLYVSTVAYFLAFVLFTATFAIFILPASSYKKIFYEKRRQLWSKIWWQTTQNRAVVK